MNNKANSITKNEYVYAIITKIITVIFGLLNSIFFARFVGSSIKGELTYITSVVTTGSVIMSLGIHHAYPYYRKKAEDKEEYITTFASTCFVMFISLLCIGTGIALGINILFSVKYIFLMIPLMVLWCYNRVMGYIVMVEKPNKKNKAVLCFTFIEMIIALSFYLFMKRSFVLGVVCVINCQVFEFIYYTFDLRKHIKILSFKFKFLLRIAVYGFFPMLALLMNTLNYKIDVFMLKGYDYIQNSDIGVYSIGIALAEKVLLIPDAIQEILLSKLAKNKGADEVALVCRLTFPLSIFISLAIVVLGKPFIHYFYGAEYDGAYIVTVISIVGTAFMIFYKMISQYNIICKRQKQNVILLGAGIVINILLNCLLVPLSGINGAAIATGVGYAICSLLFIITFSRNAKIGFSKITMISRKDIAYLKDIIRKAKKQNERSGV